MCVVVVVVCRERGSRGSSPEPSEGSAVVLGVGLPPLLLGRLVVDVGGGPRVLLLGVVLHHLELGLDRPDLSTRAEVGGDGAVF